MDAGVFEAFDYVALGHLHGPQSAGKETVRYCGSPLKYSFSEVRHQKSVTVLELREKGQVTVETRPLTPRRDLEEIRGNYMEVTDRSFYETLDTDRYFHIILTDEEDIPDAVGKLRSIYPNLMLPFLRQPAHQGRQSLRRTAACRTEEITAGSIFRFVQDAEQPGTQSATGGIYENTD